jgi:hypothetical protein
MRSIVVLALLACVLAPAPAIRAAEWEWTLIPYLWAAGAKLDIEESDDPVFGGDLEIPGLIDELEMVAMAHFEGQRSRAGFFVDAVYLSVAGSTPITARPPLFPTGAAVDSELIAGRYEGAGFYRWPLGKSAFDAVGGIRAVDFRPQVAISRTTPSAVTRTISADELLTDGFVGARFATPFGKRYGFHLRADAGTGDTDLSWTANAGFGVWFGSERKYGLDLAYEHFAFEVELDGVKNTLEISGPLAGFVWRF